MLFNLFKKNEYTKSPMDDETSIGSILKAMGAITSRDLEFIIVRQEKTNLRMGEISVNSGMCSQSDVDYAIEIQSRIRSEGSDKLKIYAEIHKCNIKKNIEVSKRRSEINNSLSKTIEDHLKDDQALKKVG